MSTPGTPSSPLHALVYMSSAVRQLGRGDLAPLVARAKERNSALGVTGVLLYSEGAFMQYIEGPEDALATVYGIICADRLHTQVFEVLREQIDAREFADWPMALCATAASGLGLPDVPAGLARRLEEPRRGCIAPLLLLQAFWNRGLGMRYQGPRG